MISIWIEKHGKKDTIKTSSTLKIYKVH